MLTNICIYLIKRKPEKVIQHFNQCQAGDICLSSITMAELEYGVANSKNIDRNRDALHKFKLPLEVLAFEESAAVIYGELRARLKSKGQLIGALDQLIAAHALSLDLTLITNNEKEFSRLPHLKLANWTK